jgi:hypothetical protein
MTYNQLRKSLEAAMQGASPQAFKCLSKQNKLEPLLESAMGQYQQSVEDGMQQALNQVMTSSIKDKSAEMSSRQAQIEETALNQAVESLLSITAFKQAS